MRHVKLRPGTATTDAASLKRLIEAPYSDIKARVENGYLRETPREVDGLCEPQMSNGKSAKLQ
jgi:hypothetical protein